MNIDDYIREHKDTMDQKYEDWKNSVHDYITAYVNKIREYYPFRLAVILGYTPDFNDGEPCEFEEHVDAGYSGDVFDSYNIREYVDLSQLPNSHIINQLAWADQVKFLQDNHNSKDLEIIEEKLAKLVDTLVLLYGKKGWKVTIDFQNSNNPIQIDPNYDCGY